MKIAGKQIMTRPVAEIVLPRSPSCGGPITVTLKAPPLMFEDVVLQRLPAPRPHKEYAMKDGKVLRDQAGVPVEKVDLEDPTFKEKVRRIGKLRNAAMVYEGLKGDKGVTWETQEPRGDSPDWEGFYSSVLEEMKAGNFTSGELDKLGDAVLILSGLKEGELASSREGFLPEGGPAKKETTAAK